MKIEFLKHIEKKTEPQIPLEMYEISGQEKISEHSLERYLRARKQNEEELNKTKNLFSFLIKKFGSKFEKSPDLMVKRLNCPNIEIKLETIKKIEELSKNEIVAILRDLLNISDIRIQERVIFLFLNLSEEERLPFLKTVLQKIDENLNNPDMKVQEVNARIIKIVSEKIDIPNTIEEKLLMKIKDGLNNPDIKVQKIATSMLLNIKLEKFLPFLELVLSNIKKGLNNPDVKVQKIAVEMVSYLQKDDRNSIDELILSKVQEGLNNSDTEIQKTATEMIFYLKKTEERYSLLKIVSKNIKREINNSGADVQRNVLDMMKILSEEEKASFFKEVLNGSNIEMQKKMVKMIEYVRREERPKFFKIIVDKGLVNELIESPLYKSKYINDENFSRQVFEKTGSGITLLGGDLKNKTIIRHIELNSFLSWQKLYEDYKLWKKNGFDYVPIEPIQSYKLNKEMELVDVYSVVLDLSVSEWYRLTGGIFHEEIENKKKKILEVLKNKSVVHGHIHDRNFCLRFFRDEKGNVDFNKKPRIYLIDFDQSDSPQN